MDDGVRTICVNLSELNLLTLEGVGILLELWQESRNRGKSFVIQELRGQVREKLRVTGLLGPLSKT